MYNNIISNDIILFFRFSVFEDNHGGFFFYFFVFLNFYIIRLFVIECLKITVKMLKTEAGVHSCSVKKVFLEISQNPRENTYARVSLIKLQRTSTLFKKRLWHRCFPVNFTKFLRTPFLLNTSGGCFCKKSQSLACFTKELWIIRVVQIVKKQEMCLTLSEF